MQSERHRFAGVVSVICDLLPEEFTLKTVLGIIYTQAAIATAEKKTEDFHGVELDSGARRDRQMAQNGVLHNNMSRNGHITTGVILTPASMSAETHFVVAAIDFGTTYSGYAFSFTRDPDSIHMMRKWEGGDPGVINQKTPTTLLLKPNGEFHSFGFGARDCYHDLEEGEAKKWYYFEKFKMSLHSSQVSRYSLYHCTLVDYPSSLQPPPPCPTFV